MSDYCTQSTEVLRYIDVLVLQMKMREVGKLKTCTGLGIFEQPMRTNCSKQYGAEYVQL